MRVIAIGRLRDGPEAELFARYAERVRPKLSVVELPEGRGSAAEVKRRETDALLQALPPAALVVALDLGGAALDSETLARRLDRWLGSGREVCFVIGGTEGLGRALLDRADATLSLGPMTWPHFLIRAMLAEQIYRARSISLGHPYHRSGRP